MGQGGELFPHRGQVQDTEAQMGQLVTLSAVVCQSRGR